MPHDTEKHKRVDARCHPDPDLSGEGPLKFFIRQQSRTTFFLINLKFRLNFIEKFYVIKNNDWEMRKIVAVGLFIWMGSISVALATKPLTTGSQAEPSQIRKSIRKGNIRFEKGTGIPLAIYRANYGPLTGSPREMAEQFLRENHRLFKIKPDLSEFELTAVQESPAGHHVRFHQVYRGVPVYRGELVVSLNRKGWVTMVTNNFWPNIALKLVRPGLTGEEAILIARGAVGVRGKLIGDQKAELVIYRDKEKTILAYDVSVPVDDPLGDWEVMVDAGTGEVLWTYDRACYVDGTGLAFNPDPLTTAGVNYGDPGYVDGGDADTPQLNAERDTVALLDLTLSGGVYHLNGPWVQILDFEPPTSPPATAIDPDSFWFTRSEQGFEDVMVYYFIDTSQRWLQSLGFDGIQHGPIQADPHGLNGADNSHYLPSSNRLAFGEGGVDDAEDADVILHEYGHAIQHSQVPSWGGGHMGAMGEGFGDYWAGSYSASISDFNRDWVFNWDGHNPFWPGRFLISNKHYPEDYIGQVHADGEMWSASLWVIYNQLNREITDRVVVQGHYYMTYGATFEDGSWAVLQADEDLYGGEHYMVIYMSFYNRGFITEPPPSGMLTGTVTDSATGEPLGEALVVVEGASDTLQAWTDTLGSYSISEIPPDTYLMTASKPGFIPDTVTGVVMDYFDTVVVNFALLHPDIAVDTLEVGVQLVQGEQTDAAFHLSNPGNGPVSYSIRLVFERTDTAAVGEGVFSFDASTPTGDGRILGAEFDSSFFYLTGANNSEQPNYVYRFDREGNYVGSFEQPGGSAGWGMRDLAWDGSFLYGSFGVDIIGFDTSGVAVGEIPTPVFPCRSIAYDPSTDHFWVSGTHTDIFEISRDGGILRQYANELRVYGLAWHPQDPDGANLYILSKDGIPPLRISRLDPVSGGISTLTQFPGSPDEDPGGLAITPDYDPARWTLVATIRGDTCHVNGYDLGARITWLYVSPLNGNIREEGEQEISLTFNAAGMDTGLYNAHLHIDHTALADSIHVLVTLRVLPFMFIGEKPGFIPRDFALIQNYPNPFNSATTIRFSVKERGRVRLVIYDVLGREVARLADGVMEPGVYHLSWEAGDIPSGIYFCRMTVNNFIKIKKMVLLR